MKTISELQELIIDWAKEKNINNPDKQYLKILEEVGETARAILKNDVPEIKDGIGDIAVTVIIYYWQKKKSLVIDTDVNIGKEDDKIFKELISQIRNHSVYSITWIDQLATNHNTTLEECLNLAWDEIKDRQGETINGTFIKN